MFQINLIHRLHNLLRNRRRHHPRKNQHQKQNPAQRQHQFPNQSNHRILRSRNTQNLSICQPHCIINRLHRKRIRIPRRLPCTILLSLLKLHPVSMIFHLRSIRLTVIQYRSILINISNPRSLIRNILQIRDSLMLHTILQISGFLFQFLLHLSAKIPVKNSQHKHQSHSQNHCTHQHC